MTNTKPCPDCEGTGGPPREPCETCSGYGRVAIPEPELEDMGQERLPL
jgi:DnaJ-class molecular chaperone